MAIISKREILPCELLSRPSCLDLRPSWTKPMLLFFVLKKIFYGTTKTQTTANMDQIPRFIMDHRRINKGRRQVAFHSFCAIVIFDSILFIGTPNINLLSILLAPCLFNSMCLIIQKLQLNLKFQLHEQIPSIHSTVTGNVLLLK